MERKLSVEDLEKYGTLTMSNKVFFKQGRIMFSVFVKSFGILETSKMISTIIKKSKKLKKENTETYKKAFNKMGKVPANELIQLSALFLTLSEKYGREGAYEFLKTKILSEFGKYSMRDMYQVAKLKKCQGDIFENFKKFNIAAFKGISDKEQFLMENYTDELDKLTIKVVTCINCELFKEMGVPELGKFGCDHDIYGYKDIENDVNCEFRRFKTIAKGDAYCLFEFYRKGTAPDNEQLNKKM